MNRRKKRKHCVRVGQPLRNWTAANKEWALDFAHDAVACGRAIRVLTVVDAYTRECLALEVDTSFAGPESDAGVGGDRGRARAAAGHRLRQRAGTNKAAFPRLVRGAADRAAAHSTRKADAERTCGKFSWTAARRVLGSKLVPEFIRCAAEDCGVAERVQRGAATQQFEIFNTEGICYIDEGG